MGRYQHGSVVLILFLQLMKMFQISALDGTVADNQAIRQNIQTSLPTMEYPKQIVGDLNIHKPEYLEQKNSRNFGLNQIHERDISLNHENDNLKLKVIKEVHSSYLPEGNLTKMGISNQIKNSRKSRHNSNTDTVTTVDSKSLKKLPLDKFHDHHFHHSHNEIVEKPKARLEPNVGMVKFHLGEQARLNCSVHNPGELSVSWMRQVDDVLELITYDDQVYANDNRYSLESSSGDTWKRWSLLINSTTLQDAGLYRCRVATNPPLVQDNVLEIIAPRTRVVDEKGADVLEKHYNSGSMIQLKCYIDRVPFPIGKVRWMKGSTTLMFNTSIGGISIKGDPITGLVTSRLYVANASPKDSGIYSCWYKNYTSDDIAVHVIAGEYLAAMQHDSLPEESNTSISNSTALLAADTYLLKMITVIMWLSSLFFDIRVSPSSRSRGTTISSE